METGVYKDIRFMMPISFTVPFFVTSNANLDICEITTEELSTYEGVLTSWKSVQEKSIPITTGHFYQAMPIFNCGWLEECVNYRERTYNLNEPSFKQVTDILRNENLALTTKDIELPEDEKFFENANKQLLYIITGGPGGYAKTLNSLKENLDDILTLPIPNYYGNTTAKICFYSMVLNTSNNKEAAWNFTKILLSEEIQEKISIENPIRTTGLPVMSKYIDSCINKSFDKSFIEKNYRIYDLEISSKIIDDTKSLCFSYDNVYFPDFSPLTIYNHISEYLEDTLTQSNTDYESMKMELENYLKIYLSE